MKTSILSVLCAIITAATVGCGLQEGSDTPPAGCTANCGDGGTPGDGGNDNPGDAGTTPPSDGGTAPTCTMPAPFRSLGPSVMDFSIAYVSASLCGELRGDLPGMNWEHGPFLMDRDAVSGVYDGYLGTAMEVPVGTYNVTYVDRACPGEVRQGGNWADYGDLQLQVLQMCPDARAYLLCTQYDAASNSCHTVSNPGCHISFHVDSMGNITPAGNMRDLSSAATGCW